MQLASRFSQVRVRLVLDVALAVLGLSLLLVNRVPASVHAFAALYLIAVAICTAALDFGVRRVPLFSLAVAALLCGIGAAQPIQIVAIATAAAVSIALAYRFAVLPPGDWLCIGLAVAAEIAGYVQPVLLLAGVCAGIVLFSNRWRATYPLAGTIAANLAILAIVSRFHIPRF